MKRGPHGRERPPTVQQQLAASDPVAVVLTGAGFAMYASSPLLDFTWDVLHAALEPLSADELGLLALGESELMRLPNSDASFRGWWTVYRVQKAGIELREDLRVMAASEESMRRETHQVIDTPLLAIETDRDWVRVAMAGILCHDRLAKRAAGPARVLTNMLGLGLMAVVDARFDRLRVLLKGRDLAEAARALGGVGARLRMLLLELRYARHPNADLLARLHDAFEELRGSPTLEPKGTLLLRENGRGFQAVLGELTCPLSENEVALLRKLPSARQPILGSKLLAERWGLKALQDRQASATYSTLARKLRDHLQAPCLLNDPRGGKYGLLVAIA